MSYILDALKRAEAERDRGAVPTLNTQALASTVGARRGSPLPYVVIGVGVLLVLLLALLLWRSWGGAPAPQIEPQQPLAQAPAPIPVQTPAQTQRKPAPPPVARNKAVPQPAPVARPVSPPVQAAAPAPVLTMAELPDAVRRSLPPLKFGGAMYSDAPASRVLILNGQLLHEAEAVQPGLVIETIGVHKATLVQNGQRFSIDY